MSHQIKISRAASLTSLLPMARAEVMSSLSPGLIERLTAAEIADVMQCLDAHWHKAVNHTERRVLSEGCVWDADRQSLAEVVRATKAAA